MIIRSKYLILLALTFAVGACSLFNGEQDDDRVVARVYDNYLYEDELKEVIPKGLSKDDSTAYAQNYIYNWAKEQLVIAKAEFNLSEEDEKDFEELIQNYRKDLLKFRYQQRYVDQNLDTNITDEEIIAYYEENKKNFELKDNILRMRYMVLGSDAPDLKNVRKWFRGMNEEDVLQLHEYAFKFARTYSFDDTAWVSYDDLSKVIPLQTYNQQEFLTRNKFAEVEDSTGIYFLRIDEYRIKDDASPLPYVYNTIKSILINRRKLQMISDVEKALVDDAYENKDFEIYK